MTISNSASTGQLLQPISPEPLVDHRSDPFGRTALGGIGAFFLILTFIQAPGLIVDDTKLPVIMAPLAWMRSALHLWNPSVSSGSVQAGTFGYLFPMAPFFELTHVLHIPVWIAERIWLATLLTVGAWGVIRLSEALGIGTRRARVLGAIAYCVAPIVVDWAAISALLLAVVFLPWVLQPLVVGAREGSPRRAAAKSGIAVALMGGVNATIVVSALPLAVIWLFTRAPGPRRRSLMGWWVVCVVMACFWWAVATILQGKYGYNYLPYTETPAITTSPASAFEAIRGASNWQNYYDLGGPLVPGGWTLVTSWVGILATAIVAALGLAGLARRIPERLFLVAGLSFGVVVIAIGYGGKLGGPFSSRVVSLLSGGLGPLRNVSKFSPDVALPIALGLIWLISTTSVDEFRGRWARRLPVKKSRTLVGAIALVAVVFAAIPFWQQQLYPSGGFAAIPLYWAQAAEWLDHHQGTQTALLVPGAPFAQYTWGDPQDEPLSVLTSTSITARSIIPLGSDQNTDMLSAVEDALATGSPQPGLASYLSRSGVDYVVERNDLNLRATGALPPAQVHQVLSESPGLVRVAAFGSYLPRSQIAQGILPVYDAPSYTRLRPVEIYRVEPKASEVQTFPASSPLVVSGSAGSLLPLAGTRVLDGHAAVLGNDLHSATAASKANATWVITDGNQRRAVAFGKVDNNLSYLLGPEQELYRYPPLTYGSPGPTDSQTVAAPIGAKSVDASSYSSTTLNLDPSEGPASAFDGNPSTAWVASGAGRSIGQWVSITFDREVDLKSIAIAPLDDSPNRPTIEWVTLTTDRGSVRRYIPVRSTPVTVTVAPGWTRQLKIAIYNVRSAKKRVNPPLGAGITDVTIPGVSFTPAMRLPSDQLSTFSKKPQGATILNFADPVTNPNLDFDGPISNQPPITRRFALPKAMSTTISGTAVPNPGPELEALLSALTTSPKEPIQVSASSSLRDLPRFRAQNLIGSSPLPWIAGLNDKDPSITLRWSGIRSVDSIAIGVSNRASRPTGLLITSPSGSRTVSLPRHGGVVSFAPLNTDTMQIHFLGVVERKSTVPTGSLPVGLPRPTRIVLPVGLSSVAVPSLENRTESAMPVPSTRIALPCGSGPTVDVDDVSLPTQVSGTLGNLVNLQPMDIHLCGAQAAELGAGENNVSFPPGSAFRVTGLLIEPADSVLGASSPGPKRTVTVLSWNPGVRTLRVGAGSSAYVQVSENYNPGWAATMDGHRLQSVSLDGWEQAWVVPSSQSGIMTMTFTPDRTYRAGLLIGGLLLLALFLLAFLGKNRSRKEPVGPRSKLPSLLLVGGAAVVVFCVGGVLVFLLVPLVAATYRWGTRFASAIAGLAFAAAGILVAVQPNSDPFGYILSSGAFGAPAQLLSVVALGAVLSAVIVDDGRLPLGLVELVGSPGGLPAANGSSRTQPSQTLEDTKS